MDDLKEKIRSLKRTRDAVILAHYYTDGPVQELADYVGDSYYLSKVATEVPQQTILLCGVSFMGESAKLLNPKKTVLLPNRNADCPMAHMTAVSEIEEIRARYDDAAVVCYINSTAEVKAHSDVCVTSSNALKIVRALPNRTIYFIPDENLGRYIAARVPEKHFLLGHGFCHVHTSIKRAGLEKAKALHPDAPVLAHPECTQEVLECADYIGSTSGIIAYAAASDASEFLICTEVGILHELQKQTKNKRFYAVGCRQFCPNMKKITLEDMLEQLETMKNQVELRGDLSGRANRALEKMLALAR